jgi:hypothetical protein
MRIVNDLLVDFKIVRQVGLEISSIPVPEEKPETINGLDVKLDSKAEQQIQVLQATPPGRVQ